MAGKVIAVANMKGGVGKTATVVGLAEAFAAAGNSVLVIDLDAQANASICIAGDSTLADLMRGQRTVDAFISEFTRSGWATNFDDFIHPDASNVSHQDKKLKLSLMASSPALRDLERQLLYVLTARGKTWEDIVEALWDLIREQLIRTKNSYDIVLIDCAPGISVLTEVSIRLSDLAIVPTIPDFLSTFGLDAFCANLWDRNMTNKLNGAPRRVPYVLATRCRPVNVHRDTVAALRQEALSPNRAFNMFKATVPEAVAIANALGQLDHYAPFTQKWSKPVAKVLNDIVNEVREALDARD